MDLTLLISDDLAGQIDDAVTAFIINPLLIHNMGEQYVDQVRLVHQPLADDDKTLIRGILRDALAKPNNFDLLTQVLDFDAMLDRGGLPRREDTIKILEETEPPPNDAALKQMTDSLAAVGATDGEKNTQAKDE